MLQELLVYGRHVSDESSSIVDLNRKDGNKKVVYRIALTSTTFELNKRVCNGFVNQLHWPFIFLKQEGGEK